MAGTFSMRSEVVSGGPLAACARGVRTRPAAPADERVVRKRRRVCISGIGSPAYAGSTLSLCYRYERCRGNDFSYSCAARHHVALLTPEALRRLGLLPTAMVLDLKGRLRCRGCGRKGRATPLPLR